MSFEEKAQEQARMLRNCADRGSCTKCPLDGYIGCCTDKLKEDSAELIEDQQALIRSLTAKVEGMMRSIETLRDKYSGGKYEPEETD